MFQCEIFSILFSYEDKDFGRSSNLHWCTFNIDLVRVDRVQVNERRIKKRLVLIQSSLSIRANIPTDRNQSLHLHVNHLASFNNT